VIGRYFKLAFGHLNSWQFLLLLGAAIWFSLVLLGGDLLLNWGIWA
jgi:hypothetical protein